MILWDNSYVYATDPNKNVRVKRFPNDWMGSGWIEEFFDYKPFGELKNYVANPPRFMFSSEEYMPETGMYHYLYRAYSPSLARFITRDPIEEAGGVNLYCFVNNNPVSKWDKDGNFIAQEAIPCLAAEFLTSILINAFSRMLSLADISTKVREYCYDHLELPGKDFLVNMKLNGNSLTADTLNTIKSCLLNIKGLENLISVQESMTITHSSPFTCYGNFLSRKIKFSVTIRYTMYADFTLTKSRPIYDDTYTIDKELGIISSFHCCNFCTIYNN